MGEEHENGTELPNLLRRRHAPVDKSVLPDLHGGSECSLDELKHNSAVNRITKVQRAFRRMIYKFDRVALIERLRLELRLRVVGFRVLVWLLLLVLVGLNMMSTNESSSYVFSLTSTLDSILQVDVIGDSVLWTDTFNWVDNELGVLYSLGTENAGLTLPSSPVLIGTAFGSSSTLVSYGDSFGVTTWIPVMYESKKLRASLAGDESVLCWEFSIDKQVGTIEFTVGGSIHVQSVYDSVFQKAHDRQLVSVSFSNSTADVYLNGGTLVGSFDMYASVVSVECLSNSLVLSADGESESWWGSVNVFFSGFYYYIKALPSEAELKSIFTAKQPFYVDPGSSSSPPSTTSSITNTTYLYQSIPRVSDVVNFTQTAFSSYITSPYQMVFPGLVSVSLNPSVGRSISNRPISTSVAVVPANTTHTILDHGFDIVESAEPNRVIFAKSLSVLFPSELAQISARNNNFFVHLHLLVEILDIEKLVFYSVQFGPHAADNIVNTYQVYLPTSPNIQSSKLFQISALIGIIVSSFFLCKDILVFAVNILVWSTTEREYIKQRASGVLASRSKQVLWMVSNVFTNAIVLVLLIGRISVGLLSDNVVVHVNDLVKSSSDSQTAASLGNSTQPYSHAMYNTVTELDSIFSNFFNWESLGVVVLYVLVARVIHSLSGHPRVGILTSTWRSASDDVIHLSANFFVLFLAQAVIGLILMKNLTTLMGTYGEVLLSQWHALVCGTWDDVLSDTSISVHGKYWVQMLYLAFFLISIKICLLNFFIAILIDAYMAVRRVVMNSAAVQSFPKDVIETAESDWMVRIGKLPNKQDVIALLLSLYEKPAVGIEHLGSSNVFGAAYNEEVPSNNLHIASPDDEYKLTYKLQHFCWRYFSKYPHMRVKNDDFILRSNSLADQLQQPQNLEWETILAELEVMTKMVKALPIATANAPLKKRKKPRLNSI